MGKLNEAASGTIVKMLLIGDSGAGKTGALASLVSAGYELRILDLDNKLQSGILPVVMRREKLDFSKVEFEALRDKTKSTPTGIILDGPAKAFGQAASFVDKWSDGTKPAEWGPSKILVIDSLTFLSDAAYNWAKMLNPGSKDPRQWYFSAQNAIEEFLAYITGDSFNTNVIVISHVSWVDRPDGTMKGFPASVGKALGPTIPSYFNTLALAESTGVGEKTKRVIRTVSNGLIDMKNPASFDMPPVLPLETGLATFFKKMRGE